jgi:hypothetical protein
MLDYFPPTQVNWAEAIDDIMSRHKAAESATFRRKCLKVAIRLVVIVMIFALQVVAPNTAL